MTGEELVITNRIMAIMAVSVAGFLFLVIVSLLIARYFNQKKWRTRMIDLLNVYGGTWVSEKIYIDCLSGEKNEGIKIFKDLVTGKRYKWDKREPILSHDEDKMPRIEVVFELVAVDSFSIQQEKIRKTTIFRF